MHTVVRNGSINVYRFLVGLLIRINKKCDSVIGKIDFEKEGTKNYASKTESLSDCSDNEDDSNLDKTSNKNSTHSQYKIICDIDGDIPTTEESDEESDNDKSEKKDLISNKEFLPKDEGSIKANEQIKIDQNFTSDECEILRRTILDIFSYQNLKGDTILHEAVKEDRKNFLENIKCLQMVRQNIKNNKGLSFEELQNYLNINAFIRRYQNVENEAKNRARKKRICRFFDVHDDEDEEESMSIIKMQKILTPEERRSNEMRALMKFVYFFIFLLVLFVAYLLIKTFYNRSRQTFPPPKLM